MAASAPTLSIEIFSDVICPWCFIGKKRLDKVLAGDLGTDVSLRWRPYLLYPGLPLEGVDRSELLRRRYGDDADPGRIPSRIAEEAAAEGIKLRYDLMMRTPNTLLAHRTLEFAHAQGRQHEMAEALFQAYFCRGRDVGDVSTLAAIADETGLSGSALQVYLAGDDGKAEIANELARAPTLGISGVPGYYLANSFLLPGAQSEDVMTQILTRVKTKLAERKANEEN